MGQTDVELPAPIQDFVREAPFVVLATANSAGDCDASPKGGRPGFVRGTRATLSEDVETTGAVFAVDGHEIARFVFNEEMRPDAPQGEP